MISTLMIDMLIIRNKSAVVKNQPVQKSPGGKIRRGLQSVKKGESAIRKTKKAGAGYQSVFARTCAS